MKYDCHFNVMSLDHVTSQAAYGSNYKGILENLSFFFDFFDIMWCGNYGIENSYCVYHVKLADCGYYYDMQ